jgi:hypothetical protein
MMISSPPGGNSFAATVDCAEATPATPSDKPNVIAANLYKPNADRMIAS